MNRRAVVVTDLGYGDAGKGTATDFLVRQAGSAMVIRHNGGAQAGHNVVLPNGRHHTFSQFGSGSFVSGVRTHLSQYMLVNPLTVFPEADHLIQLGVTDAWQRLSVDCRAKITTPWHVAVNRLRELARGAGRHGSCGLGVGETMADHIARPEMTLYAGDFRMGTRPLESRLMAIRNFKLPIARELAATIVSANQGNQSLQQSVAKELESFTDENVRMVRAGYHLFAKRVRIVPIDWLAAQCKQYELLVFEGAQGVLLDESYGFHPYTTWSNTTHDNALAILDEVDFSGHITRLGVLRSYSTRHGAGPFVSEDASLKPHLPEPHNAHHEWQQAFRVGALDLVALRYAVEVCGGVDELMLTHLDRAHHLAAAVTGYQLGAGAQVVPADLFASNPEGIITAIKPGLAGDLGRQSRLTDALFSCRPATWYPYLESAYAQAGWGQGRLSQTVAGYELIKLVATELAAPVTYTSNGPTWADKQVLSSAMR